MDKNARLEEEINLLKTNLEYNKVELEFIKKPRTKTEPLLIAIDLHGLTVITGTELLNKYLEVDHLLKYTPRVRFITGTAKTRLTPPVLRPLLLRFLNEHYVVAGRRIVEFDAFIDLCFGRRNGNGPDSEKENRIVETVRPSENKKAKHSIIETAPDSGVESDGHVPKNQKKRKQNRIVGTVKPNENKKAEHSVIEMAPDSGVESDGHVPKNQKKRKQNRIVGMVKPNENKKANHSAIEVVAPDSGVESDGHVPKNQKKRKQPRGKNGNDRNNQQKDRREPGNKKNHRIVEMMPSENETEKLEHCVIEIPLDDNEKQNDETNVPKRNNETNISKQQEDNWVYYIAHRIYKTYASVVTAFYKKSTSFYKRFFSRH